MNKKEVEALLVSFGSMVKDKAPTDAKGNLDVKALNQMPECIDLKDALRMAGVRDAAHLSGEGFMVAAMILRF